jgi:hypothetical protein
MTRVTPERVAAAVRELTDMAPESSRALPYRVLDY